MTRAACFKVPARLLSRATIRVSTVALMVGSIYIYIYTLIYIYRYYHNSTQEP